MAPNNEGSEEEEEDIQKDQDEGQVAVVWLEVVHTHQQAHEQAYEEHELTRGVECICVESKIYRKEKKLEEDRGDKFETFLWDTVHLVSVWVVNDVSGCIS